MSSRRLRALVATLAVGALSLIVPASSPAAASATIRVIRDHYGVPHVFAATETAASYGAGYALAQDRLAQMDLLRHIAEGKLSELLGPVVLDMDESVRQVTYTDAERLRKFHRFPVQLQQDEYAFATGINAWIAKVDSDPTKLPAEYVTLGIGAPAPWKVTDSVAIADLLVLQFGAGGGNELDNVTLLRDLVAKLGCRAGVKAFNDVKWLNDPSAPTTVPKSDDWHTSPTDDPTPNAVKPYRSDARLSLPAARRDAGAAHVPAVRASEPCGGGQVALSPGATIGTDAQLGLTPPLPAGTAKQYAAYRAGRAMLETYVHFGSNAELIGPSRTADHGTLLLGAPQVSYYTPEIVVDIGIHGGALQADGMTFAGVGPVVLIGRGAHYAWTTTTGDSDGADTYVERLNPADPTEYLFHGRWEREDCRTESYDLHGLPIASQQVCRTRHGPVLAVDTTHHVAYALRMGWFDREDGTVEGFYGYDKVHSISDFAHDANMLMSNHNMFYADDRGHIGYWHPGAIPIRARGVDIRLPQDGTGTSEWVRLRTAQEMPHSVDPKQGWLTNWNNKPASDWTDGDGVAYGADHKVTDHMDVLRREPHATWQTIVGNVVYAATHEHYYKFLAPYLPVHSTDPLVRTAVRTLQSWNGLRVDRNGDGKHDSAGYDLAQEWLRHLVSDAFGSLPDGYGDLGSLPDPKQAGTDDKQRGLLLRVLAGKRAALPVSRDYLGGMSVPAFAEKALKEAAQTLASASGSNDPSTWARPMEKIHFTRLNADLLLDEGRSAVGAGLPPEGVAPGDTRDIDFQDRGTYNQIVHFSPVGHREPPADDTAILVTGSVRDAYGVTAGSVIPPGQNGFIGATGEGPHYQDQLAMYEKYTFKPMPFALDDVRAQQESEEDLTYPG